MCFVDKSCVYSAEAETGFVCLLVVLYWLCFWCSRRSTKVSLESRSSAKLRDMKPGALSELSHAVRVPKAHLLRLDGLDSGPGGSCILPCSSVFSRSFGFPFGHMGHMRKIKQQVRCEEKTNSIAEGAVPLLESLLLHKTAQHTQTGHPSASTESLPMSFTRK